MSSLVSTLLTHSWADASTPVIDADAFIRGETWKWTSDCQVDESKKMFLCPSNRLLVQTWASLYTPAEIQANKKHAEKRFLAAQHTVQKEMPFIGSVWDCNVQEFIDFSAGCEKVGMKVIKYGEHGALNMQRGGKLGELLDRPNFFVKLTKGSLDEVFAKTGAVYGPSFQGAAHLHHTDLSLSYIADRVLNLISIGVFPMTNNPASLELLGNPTSVIFDEDVSSLCSKVLSHQPDLTSLFHLMDTVALEHTYVARFSNLLHFLAQTPFTKYKERSFH